MATVIDVENLGDRGFAIEGATRGDDAGSSVRAGDVNGDGLIDLIVTAPGADSGGRGSQGAVFVIYGTGHGFDAIDLADITPASGDVFRGERQKDLLSRAASAGDVNGDGIDDLIMGAPLNDDHRKSSGAVYVVFGKAGGIGPVDLAHLAPDEGYRIDGGSKNAGLGGSVAAAGDVNGDGVDDFVMGATNAAGGTGAAYVVFGKAQGLGPVDLNHLAPADGFAILGAAVVDLAGGSVMGAGDVNGDGYDDVIVGAGFNDDGGDEAGAAYVVFGKADGFKTIDLADLRPADGFVLRGEEGSRAGSSVAAAGDINGDGYADIVVGAPDLSAPGDQYHVGAAYVIFGKAGGFGSIDLEHLAPADGFAMTLKDPQSEVGASVSSAGDVNGDGYADLIVGAPFLAPDIPYHSTGAVYVIFGKADGFGPIDLDDLAPAEGFMVVGTQNSHLGNSVSRAGDVNGDGVDDLIVGAVNSNTAYVIYGTLPTEDVVRIGSAIGQTIRGGPGDDRLEGRGGDDVLIGSDGDDALSGDEGNDDLNGGDGRDKLSGGVGDDIMHGGDGKDRLSGGAGDDGLYGGTGTDILTGGAGADRFHFSLGGSAADAKHADRITDFHQAEHDVIDLSDYDADPAMPGDQPFDFVGTAAFSGVAGEVRYAFAGSDTLVSGDTDGDRVADFTVRLSANVALTQGDFLLAAAAAPAVGGGHSLLAPSGAFFDSHLHLA